MFQKLKISPSQIEVGPGEGTTPGATFSKGLGGPNNFEQDYDFLKWFSDSPDIWETLFAIS